MGERLRSLVGPASRGEALGKIQGKRKRLKKHKSIENLLIDPLPSKEEAGV